MTGLWFTAAVLTVVGLSALLVFAWRRQRLGIAFLGVTVLLASFWALAKIAVEHDYGDADGYVDCWPHCTGVQQSVILGIGGAPIAWILLGVLAAVLSALTGPRGREWKPLRGERDDAEQSSGSP
jgi:hypothetical protein